MSKSIKSASKNSIKRVHENLHRILHRIVKRLLYGIFRSNGILKCSFVNVPLHHKIFKKSWDQSFSCRLVTKSRRLEQYKRVHHPKVGLVVPDLIRVV